MTTVPAAESALTDVDVRLAALGVRVPDILIPRPDVDLATWAVVACDQFTSQRDYWTAAEELVGDAPSTLRAIFPEAYLEDPDPEARIAGINASMTAYAESGLLLEHPHTMFLVKRTTGAGISRWGLLVALDLEAYDWHAGSTTLIRATEGTIESRIPPRKLIRGESPLELPHIMVLISDAQRSVIEPLAARIDELTSVYDTDLMAGGGHVSAWAVTEPADLGAVADALGALHAALDPANPLLFAMGDGNHSFATAKSIWMDVKQGLSEAEQADHPARFALVELENIFDPGLEFEPIHRVLFGCDRATFEAELARHCTSFTFRELDGASLAGGALESAIEDQSDAQRFGYCDADIVGVYAVARADANIAPGTLQHLIDALVAAGAAEVDYIHGTAATEELGRTPGNIGLILPPVSKDTFFAAILADGALPRKTFSMGEAADKRYYLEARRIR